MKNKKYNQGFSVVGLLGIITVIAAIGGGYLLMSKNKLPNGEDVGRSNAVLEDFKEGVSNVIENTPISTAKRGEWSNNLCDYFTLADAKQYLTQNVYAETDPQVLAFSKLGCQHMYTSSSGEKEIAADFFVIYKGSSVEDAKSTWNSFYREGFRPVEGIGDDAYEGDIDKRFTALSFIAGKTIATISIEEPGTKEENLIKAQNIAKKIIPRLPQ